MKICIRMPNWLGDLVMATPILEEAKRKWPGAEITAICKDPLIKLLEGHPHVDHLLPLSQAKGIHAEIGILLTNSFSSAWHFFKQRIDMRIGFRNEGRSLLLTHPLPFPNARSKEHLVDTYKRLLNTPFSSSQPTLALTPDELADAKQTLTKLNIPDNRPIIGVNPAAAYGPAKCWLPERFREVTKRFTDHTFLYFGDAAGEELVTSICENLGPNVINLAGKTTIREFMALIKLCTLFLTNDSGPMHLAAALKTPLIALFGSTNEVATGPYRFGTIIHKHVACSPCYKRTCPIDFRCMTQITVDEVEHAIRALSKKPLSLAPSTDSGSLHTQESTL